MNSSANTLASTSGNWRRIAWIVFVFTVVGSLFEPIFNIGGLIAYHAIFDSRGTSSLFWWITVPKMAPQMFLSQIPHSFIFGAIFAFIAVFKGWRSIWVAAVVVVILPILIRIFIGVLLGVSLVEYWQTVWVKFAPASLITLLGGLVSASLSWFLSQQWIRRTI